MISTQQHRQYIQQLQSSNPVEVYSALRTIKNTIIGSSIKKTLYFQLQIIPSVTSLLALDDTDVQIQVQATAIISSLAHKGEGAAKQLLDSGVLTPLINQIAPGSDPVLMEISERALNALLAYTSTKMGAEEHTGTMIPYLLSIVTEGKSIMSVYDMHSHARVELAVLILGKLCVTEPRQYTIADMGAISLLVPLLCQVYPRLQVATLRTLSALSYENGEICTALTNTGHNGKPFATILLDLARSHDPEIRLTACLCLSNLSRMRVASAPLKEVQTVVVPALVKLMACENLDKIQVIRALGYLCHEEDEMQKAARDAGAIVDLIKLLADIESEQDGDFVDIEHNTKLTKAILLSLGTIVSTDDECRRKAVDCSILRHLVLAMGSKDSEIRAAACLCARYITRSASICRTHLPECGILKPILNLLSDRSEEVQVTASATLVNLMLNLSPVRMEALKEGVIDMLVKLLQSENVMIRRNALWSVRNTVTELDDDNMLKEILDKIKVERLYELAIGQDEPMTQEQAACIFRNIVNEGQSGINILFDTLGSERMISLIQQLLTAGDDKFILHGLYLFNNVAVRSPEHCDLIARCEILMQAVIGFLSSSSPELIIGAVWCISGVASHKVDGAGDNALPKYIDELNLHNVQSRLESLAADPRVSFEVHDRVKSCLDNFTTTSSAPS
ncbi:hypothetical protein EC988_000997 [Linderina pennispora]|nr:hypothetical protein EC988_000997 [Linderina pennispora]